MSCTFLYLGVMTENIVSKEDRYLLKMMLAACNKANARKWYKLDPPAPGEWMEIVNEIEMMEQLTHQIPRNGRNGQSTNNDRTKTTTGTIWRDFVIRHVRFLLFLKF